MNETLKDEQAAPTLDDLSYVQVHNSHLFGITNMTGKGMSLIALGALVPGAIGVAQAIGMAGPVAGITLSIASTAVALGGSFVSAMTGYWLGNFDDRAIRNHNEAGLRAQFGRARGITYNNIERGFLSALARIPESKTLPYDALGHAVDMSDDKLASLPPHLLVQIYSTQADLELYRAKQLTLSTTLEAQDFLASLKKATTPQEKADAYRGCRDYLREQIKQGSLLATPHTQKAVAAHAHGGDDGFDDPDLFSVTMQNMHANNMYWMVHNNSYSAGGGFGGGDYSTGESFGGSDFSTGGELGVGSGISSGSGKKDNSSGKSDFKMDGKAAEGLAMVALIAAVSAAAIATGFSLWKNFLSQAPKPDLGGVSISKITNALSSSRADIDKMYGPRSAP